MTFGRSRGTGKTGVYLIILAYKEEKPARAAFESALQLTVAAMHNRPFDLTAELAQLRAPADDYRLGPSTAAIVDAASRLRYQQQLRG